MGEVFGYDEVDMGEVSDLILRISNAFRLFANLILGDVGSGY